MIIKHTHNTHVLYRTDLILNPTTHLVLFYQTNNNKKKALKCHSFIHLRTKTALINISMRIIIFPIVFVRVILMK